jgi:hypothetical protein
MIYVDELESWGTIIGYSNQQAERVGARHNHQWCHMFADEADCEELHEFAKKIGLKREWFQRDYYDLVPTKRAKAIMLGGKPVSRLESVAIWKQQKGYK